MSSDDLILHLLIGPLMLFFSVIFILFPPKKINSLYGHRTSTSMLNPDTWKTANNLSSKMMLYVSIITCLIQLSSIILAIDVEKSILYATLFLVVSLIFGVVLVEKELKKIFDNKGNRK
jgi:uncharacterized membrane protein